MTLDLDADMERIKQIAQQIGEAFSFAVREFAEEAQKLGEIIANMDHSSEEHAKRLRVYRRRYERHGRKK